jgi:hypothetical protein
MSVYQEKGLNWGAALTNAGQGLSQYAEMLRQQQAEDEARKREEAAQKRREAEIKDQRDYQAQLEGGIIQQPGYAGASPDGLLYGQQDAAPAPWGVAAANPWLPNPGVSGVPSGPFTPMPSALPPLDKTFNYGGVDIDYEGNVGRTRADALKTTWDLAAPEREAAQFARERDLRKQDMIEELRLRQEGSLSLEDRRSRNQMNENAARDAAALERARLAAEARAAAAAAKLKQKQADSVRYQDIVKAAVSPETAWLGPDYGPKVMSQFSALVSAGYPDDQMTVDTAERMVKAAWTNPASFVGPGGMGAFGYDKVSGNVIDPTIQEGASGGFLGMGKHDVRPIAGLKGPDAQIAKITKPTPLRRYLDETIVPLVKDNTLRYSDLILLNTQYGVPMDQLEDVIKLANQMAQNPELFPVIDTRTDAPDTSGIDPLFQ